MGNRRGRARSRSRSTGARVGTGPIAETTFGFDAYRRLESLQHKLSGAAFQSFEFIWDVGGDLLRKKHDKVDGSKGDLYLHDSYHRLVGAKQGVPQSEIDGSYAASTSAAKETTYALDPGQNRTSVTVKLAGQSPSTTGYTTESASPRYATVGAVTPIYDAEGNLVFDGDRYYVYDFRNRLSEVYEMTEQQSMALQSQPSGGRVQVGSARSRVTVADLRRGRGVLLERAQGDLVSHCRSQGMQAGDARWTYRTSVTNAPPVPGQRQPAFGITDLPVVGHAGRVRR